MEISVEERQANVPVTIMRLSGQLDASNYEEVIERVRHLSMTGRRYLLFDLGGLTFMSSSGLVALHSAALLMRGEEPPSPEAGWQAFHAIAEDVGQGFEKQCKLLNPQPRVQKTLELTGFSEFLEVYTDEEEALSSFGE
jgi:anti-anti-sigma regulatory factor